MKKITRIYLLTVCALFSLASSNAQTVVGTLFKDAGTGDWSIGGTGENLEIREPEQSNYLWARFTDNFGLELTQHAPNLQLESGYLEMLGYNKYIKMNYGTLYLNMTTNYQYGLGYYYASKTGLSIFSDNVVNFVESDIKTTRASFDLNVGKFYFDGKIGIGTSDPGTSLEITSPSFSSQMQKGQIHIDAPVGTNNDAYISFNYGSSQKWSLGYDIMDGAFVITKSLKTNENPFLVIEYTGNVGIGVDRNCYSEDVYANLDSKLVVAGRIHASEVLVDMAGCVTPDYVFGTEYNLMKLEEVEEFINQNYHLPDVPSAAEMESDGMYLKEMNLLLLKKVEELTLYMIEQNQQIHDMQKQIEMINK